MYRGRYVKLRLCFQLLPARKKTSVIDSRSTTAYRHLADFSRMLVNTDKHIVI